MSLRDWVEKYRIPVQEKEIVEIINTPDLCAGDAGPWAFLKLAFLWSYAQHTYTPIIGKRYNAMCYVDLFAGSGLNCFNDSSGNSQRILGSPVLMATLRTEHPFKICFLFEKEPELAEALGNRLNVLKAAGKLTCESFKIFGDCNKEIDNLIERLRALKGCHFLLFVDPFSTEIDWRTMNKLLSLEYPSFDMIFNFQPFGVNRKRYNLETVSKFLGSEDWKKLFEGENEKTLDAGEGTGTIPLSITSMESQSVFSKDEQCGHLTRTGGSLGT